MIFSNFMFNFIFVYYLTKSAVCNDNVDNEHLNVYPYCGRLFGYRSKNDMPTSRVVNSEDSKEHELYPWVVYLKLKFRDKKYREKDSMCSGTVIAYK